MGAFFVYILKSSVCLAVFYLFHRLLLGKETFHCFNRFALLGILVLSCVIPLVEVTVHEPAEVNRQLFTLEGLLLMAENTPAGTVESEMAASGLTWRGALLLVYAVGFVFFFSVIVGLCCVCCI